LATRQRRRSTDDQAAPQASTTEASDSPAQGDPAPSSSTRKTSARRSGRSRASGKASEKPATSANAKTEAAKSASKGGATRTRSASTREARPKGVPLDKIHPLATSIQQSKRLSAYLHPADEYALNRAELDDRIDKNKRVRAMIAYWRHNPEFHAAVNTIGLKEPDDPDGRGTGTVRNVPLDEIQPLATSTYESYRLSLYIHPNDDHALKKAQVEGSLDKNKRLRAMIAAWRNVSTFRTDINRIAAKPELEEDPHEP